MFIPNNGLVHVGAIKFHASLSLQFIPQPAESTSREITEHVTTFIHHVPSPNLLHGRYPRVNYWCGKSTVDNPMRSSHVFPWPFRIHVKPLPVYSRGGGERPSSVSWLRLTPSTSSIYQISTINIHKPCLLVKQTNLAIISLFI